MAPHTRISYVLPLTNSSNGHRLGVNGLALDQSRSVLYTAGRDGLICAWDSACSTASASSAESATQPTFSQRSFKKQVQAHTNWVNDIVLADGGNALISASSDLTVKLWRPHSEESPAPQTIGLHKDFVKCLASPGPHVDWVASGALDRKLALWDLKEGRNKLLIDVGEDETNAKGSIYAIGSGGGVLASGGPESIVRVWDPRTGRRTSKFVGHTDNIRAILISATGDLIMSASSDQTIKGWSMTAGRCMFTLTMHNDSVWSLYSEHPQLSLFYSGDRSGLVAKTDVRGTTEMDNGLCLSVCQEHEGVSKVVGNGEYIWTATSSSSINRWFDANIDIDTQYLDHQRHHRTSSITSHNKNPTSPRWNNPAAGIVPPRQIPLSSILRLSNTAIYPLLPGTDTDLNASDPSLARQPSDFTNEPELELITPLYNLPDDTVEGHLGLIKHIMMNDRKTVLTVDSAGEVVLWDLLECIPVKVFGKRHIDEVATEINTSKFAISTWCTVDTRLGQIAVVLEENTCFHGEFYGDELILKDKIEFREDQRVNLGRWILTYLFQNLLDEEINRDLEYRKTILSKNDADAKDSTKPNLKIQMPSLRQDMLSERRDTSDSLTPRAEHADSAAFPTQGLGIGIATPAASNQPNPFDAAQSPRQSEAADQEKFSTESGQPRPSSDKPPIPTTNGQTGLKADVDTKQQSNAAEAVEGQAVQSPTEGEREGQGKESSGLFGKKLRNVFTAKKLGRTSMESKAVSSTDEKVEESDSVSKVSQPREETVIEDNFLGCIQKMRRAYTATASNGPLEALPSLIFPSLPIDTPVIKPPGDTIILIQKDEPDSGGFEDLYRGTVSSTGEDADSIEKAAPMWLGDMLLTSNWEFKELSKVSFMLNPMDNLLPSISGSDSLAKLNAHRMLRARKIWGYVAERLSFVKQDPTSSTWSGQKLDDTPLVDPEKYIELYCNGEPLDPYTTLNMIRTYIWKAGTDPVILYKSTGAREIVGEAEARSAAALALAAQKEKEREKEAKAAGNMTDGPQSPGALLDPFLVPVR